MKLKDIIDMMKNCHKDPDITFRVYITTYGCICEFSTSRNGKIFACSRCLRDKETQYEWEQHLRECLDELMRSVARRNKNIQMGFIGEDSNG